MRIRNAIITLLLFFTTVLSAQHFGVRGGMNLANQNWSDDLGYDLSNTTGFYVGIFGDFVLHWNLHSEIGANYIQKGATRVGQDNVEDEVALNYLEVPILLKYMIDIGDYNAMYITVGPTIGYALDGTIGDVEVDFDEEGYNQFELGGSFGIGFGFKVGKGMFSLEGRYGLGITEFFNDSSKNSSIKNNGISLGISHMF